MTTHATGSSLPVRAAAGAALALAAVGAWGCGEESCLRGGEDCLVVSPCEGLAFECSGGRVEVRLVVSGDQRVPGGLNALAAPGDFLLANDRVVAVIDAIDHPHAAAPSGGSLLDLATVEGDADSLNLVFQAVGFLPGETVVYDRARMIEGEGFAAVQVHGRVIGFPGTRVVTRYEVRPCEPGLRVRTELVNGGPDPLSWSSVDAWYWSGKEMLPFAPGPGRGFDQPGLVLPLEDSFEPLPFMAAALHSEPASAVSVTACNLERLYGFQSEQLSATGLPPRVVPPRDHEVLERFVAVADGRSLGPAVDLALEVRRQLRGEPWTELRGRLEGERLGVEAAATVHVEEGRVGEPASARTPWTQVTPGPDGRFAVRVPADRRFVVEVESFGRRVVAREVEVGREAVDLGAIPVPAPATLEIDVTVDGLEDHAQVLVHPADEATRLAVTGRLLGGFQQCAPMLGAAHGPSPACNRVLVHGPEVVSLPAGRYDLFATAGPFATVDRVEVDLAEGETESVSLVLERLAVQPEGTLSADLHVHGTLSFDSSIPDLDRVRAFLAAGLEVIVATDHDAVHDYAEAMTLLGAHDRMALVTGVETTGHILFDLVPGASLPQVIGHFNFWPVELRAEHTRRGAPWDEEMEPGMLMTVLAREGWDSATGIAQMNHPWGETEVGRDIGFARAIGLSTLEPLPRAYDGTGQGLLIRRPEGADRGNADFHAQEVMNGTANDTLLGYRAVWFYMLNEGLLRTGTANSDSHGLTDSLLGTPRNLVWTDQAVASFDRASFDRAIRQGRVLGTNGPVLEVRTTDAAGRERAPGLEPFEPAPDAALSLRVLAAPWVPIEEVRIVVNGEVVLRLSAELSSPTDPFGTDGLVRFEGAVELAPLLPPDGRDSWLVVEAGAALPPNGDLDCDGIPDTGDNDGDGTVDWRDVDWNDDGVVDDRDLAGRSAPGRCLETVGPIAEPAVPERGSSGYPFRAVTPGGYPFAFTNPLVVDRDGGGFTGPGVRP